MFGIRTSLRSLGKWELLVLSSLSIACTAGGPLLRALHTQSTHTQFHAEIQILALEHARVHHTTVSSTHAPTSEFTSVWGRLETPPYIEAVNVVPGSKHPHVHHCTASGVLGSCPQPHQSCWGPRVLLLGVLVSSHMAPAQGSSVSPPLGAAALASERSPGACYFFLLSHTA